MKKRTNQPMSERLWERTSKRRKEERKKGTETNEQTKELSDERIDEQMQGRSQTPEQDEASFVGRKRSLQAGTGGVPSPQKIYVRHVPLKGVTLKLCRLHTVDRADHRDCAHRAD